MHEMGEEPREEHVEDGVLLAPDVDVHGHAPGSLLSADLPLIPFGRNNL